MKKSIAFIGAFFMGAFAFAQVSKTDTINKTAGRKVLSNDMQNVSTDAESEAQNKETKGSATQKGTLLVKTTSESQRQAAYKMTMNKSDVNANSETQSKPAYKMTSQAARPESDGVIQKGRENRGAVKAFIKKDDSTNETIKDSTLFLKKASSK